MARLTLLAALLSSLCLPVAARAGVTVHNWTYDTQVVYWSAWGCAGVTNGRGHVCTQMTVDPGQSVSYSFPKGTSDPRVSATCLAAPSIFQSDPYGRSVSLDQALHLTGSGIDSCELGSAPTQVVPGGATRITVAEGSWGTWGLEQACSNPVGYRVRVESDRGDGDDTALNGLELSCKEGDRVAHPGYWGDWGAWARCPAGEGFVGASMRIESNQGGGDDSGGNDVRFQCDWGSTVDAAGGGGWGTWSPFATCPAGTVICGVQARVEPRQGDGDDTAMNGLRLYCCPGQTNPPTKRRFANVANTGQCLGVVGPDTGGAGSLVETYDCAVTPGQDQRWMRRQVEPYFMQFVSALNPDLCLGVQGNDSHGPGALVELSSCSDLDTQWKEAGATTSIVTFANRASGLCLGVAGVDQVGNGSRVEVYTCNVTPNQDMRWKYLD